MHIRRDAALHVLRPARAPPQEVTLGKAKFCGDVADVNVQHAVSIDIAEINTHSLEGISAKHAGFRRAQVPLSTQNSELQPARRGAIVQKEIRTEIVAKINLR